MLEFRFIRMKTVMTYHNYALLVYSYVLPFIFINLRLF